MEKKNCEYWADEVQKMTITECYAALSNCSYGENEENYNTLVSTTSKMTKT
jgi:hypothetical protein